MVATVTAMLAELGRDLRSERILPAFSCGLISGVQLLVFSVSMAAVVFAGSLAPYISSGVGLVLFSYCVIGTVVTLTSGFRGALAGAPLPTVMMLVAITSTVDLEGRALFVTSVATALIGTIATGLCFLVIGRFRLARLLRFIPYPVAGGFIAGTGGLACLVALRLMGFSFDRESLLSPLGPNATVSLAIGIAYGLGLFAAMKFWKHFLIFPASFLASAIAFQLCLAAVGMSGEEARAAGLLFSGSASGGLWPPIGPSDLPHIDWGEFAAQIPHLLILVTITLICVVMNLGGTEVAANVDLDWNREFRASGWANLLAGIGGAPPGCLIASGSIRNVLFGAETRLTGLFTALSLAAVLSFGDVLVSMFPVPLIGGVLLALGLRMMDDWLVATRRKLAWTDYMIIVIMFMTIVVFGFLEGVGIGMLVTAAIFVISLSRVDVVRSRFTMRDLQSKKIRPVPDRAILLAEGEHVQGYRLRGYLFFGSAYRLADQLKSTLKNDPAPTCILLSLEGVSGFDFSAVNAIVRFVRSADAEGVVVVVVGASDRFQMDLQAELPPAIRANVVIEQNEDHALERCEEIVIERWRSQLGREAGLRSQLLERVVDDFARHLDRQALFEELLDDLEPWLEAREFAPGESLVEPGKPRDGLMLLQKGRASQLDSSGVRLFQYSRGDAIEPRGAFDTSAATNATIADEQCRALVLAPDDRAQLEQSEPQRLFRLYEYLFTTESVAANPVQA